MTKKIMARLSQNIILVFTMLILCSCGSTEPEEPGLYDEKKCFAYNAYFLQMNEEGRFTVDDLLCRKDGMMYVLGGTYSLYESKLVLISNHKDVKLVFVADGDNWVFDQKESEGIDLLKFSMEKQAVWVPWGVIESWMPVGD